MDPDSSSFVVEAILSPKHENVKTYQIQLTSWTINTAEKNDTVSWVSVLTKALHEYRRRGGRAGVPSFRLMFGHPPKTNPIEASSLVLVAQKSLEYWKHWPSPTLWREELYSYLHALYYGRV